AVALLVVNIVFINVTAYLGLVGLGYRSSVVRTTRERLRVNARTGAYALATALFVVVLAATVVATYQHLAFAHAVNQDVSSVLDETEYSSLELVEVRTEYSGVGPFSRPESVTVVVTRDAGEEYPEVAADIRDLVQGDTATDVDVGVRFLDVQRASSIDTDAVDDGSVDAGSVDGGAVEADADAIEAGAVGDRS
ncbi:TIGR00341 family protein, partial [Halobium palmae]